MKTARKAIAAAVFAGLGALGATMLDGDLTVAEGIAAAGTALIAGAGTYAVSPGPGYVAPAPGRRRRIGRVTG